MLTFLFWNINKRPLSDPITDLALEHDIDFLILAESELDDIHLLKLLNSKVDPFFNKAVPGLPGPVQIYTRLDDRFVRPIEDSGGISIRHIKPPIGDAILLVAVHLPSKRHQTEADQALSCTRLARTIEKAEDSVGHTRTLIMGDLNMNPFEIGIVGAEGVHAISDRRIAARGSRIVAGVERRFFYNPMWGYFGDISPDPPGTYFYNTGSQVNMYWNIFDQVLIRPELLDAFSDKNLRVLTEIRSLSLLSESGRPNRNVGSDHFPILLSLNL